MESGGYIGVSHHLTRPHSLPHQRSIKQQVELESVGFGSFRRHILAAPIAVHFRTRNEPGRHRPVFLRGTRFERHEHSRVPFNRSRRIVAIQRAPLVQHMHECPKDCKDRNVRPFEPQLLRAAERLALRGSVVKEDVQLRRPIREYGCAAVAVGHRRLYRTVAPDIALGLWRDGTTLRCFSAFLLLNPDPIGLDRRQAVNGQCLSASVASDPFRMREGSL